MSMPAEPRADDQGADDGPLCCICRINYDPSYLIHWTLRPVPVNIPCWTCIECWRGLTEEQRVAHRKAWAYVS